MKAINILIEHVGVQNEVFGLLVEYPTNFGVLVANVPPLPQAGSAEDDRSCCIFAGDDGSAIVAGHTFGVFGNRSLGLQDFVVVKLDEHGVELWRWQVTKYTFCTIMFWKLT